MFVSFVCFQSFDKFCHGAVLEQHADIDVGVEDFSNACDQLGGEQRMAAEFEEVVVDAELVLVEHFTPQVDQHFLDRGTWCRVWLVEVLFME